MIIYANTIEHFSEQTDMAILQNTGRFRTFKHFFVFINPAQVLKFSSVMCTYLFYIKEQFKFKSNSQIFENLIENQYYFDIKGLNNQVGIYYNILNSDNGNVNK